jgi:RHS repeat-associated protein
VTRFEYNDPANPGLVTRVIPPRGNTGASPDYTYATTYTYHASGSQAGLLASVADPLGNTTTYEYDAVGRLLASGDPLGNAAGGVPADHRTGYAYDNENRLRFFRSPAPAAGGSPLVSETRYDEVGNPVTRIDANGQVTAYAYDERDGLFQVKESPSAWTDPAAPPADVITTEYAYDAAGNLTRVIRAKGDPANERVTEYAHDGRGAARSETQYPAWPTTSPTLLTSSTYDENGNLATLTDALGRTTSYAYDALNRLTSIDYSDPATPDVAYAYDANGNRTQMVDGTGTTTYAYDELDRLLSVTSPGSTTVGYRYDRDGNRTRLIYPDAFAVTYTFDKAGRLASLADSGGRSVAYTYFPDGALASTTNPNGTRATYSYDNARRLIEILHAGPTATTIDQLTYDLDAVGNVTGITNPEPGPSFGRPDGLASSSGTWSGTFASINEPTPNDTTFIASPTNPSASTHYEVTLSDAGLIGNSSVTVRYRYAKSGNNSGQTINLTVQLRQGSTVIASATHSNIPGVTGSGWQAAAFTLTAAQRAAITNPSDLRLRFAPVAAAGGGQKRSAQISWTEVEFGSPAGLGATTTYGYDRLYRLVSATDAAGLRAYTYDPAGNRTAKTLGSSTSYTYDRADRISSAGSTSITVDAVGNLIARGSDTFIYDGANRLVSATVAGITETYTYDGDGVRFSRQVGAGPLTRYVTDPSGSLPVTIADGARRYVWDLGLAYAVSGSSVEVYHADRLGTVRELTGPTGAIVAAYRSDEYGLPTLGLGSAGQPFRFTGEPLDATGLVYLRARYYHPDLGRFMTMDTWRGSVGAPLSLNRYATSGTIRPAHSTRAGAIPALERRQPTQRQGPRCRPSATQAAPSSDSSSVPR